LRARSSRAAGLGFDYQERSTFRLSGVTSKLWFGFRRPSFRRATGEAIGAEHLPTEALAACPYLSSVLESFQSRKQSVRVLTLAAGARIVAHYDPDSSVDRSSVRLHVPIITNPDVEFTIAGQRANLSEGELWYGDFSFPHAAHNRGQTPRVHLVMDFDNDEALRAMFPQPYLEDSLTRGIYRQSVCRLFDARGWLGAAVARRPEIAAR
jgi:quercetin dioxygenase-like cupin family protein